jgi:hypothetical protein
MRALLILRFALMALTGCAHAGLETASRPPVAPPGVASYLNSLHMVGQGPLGRAQFSSADLESVYEDGIIGFTDSPDPAVRRVWETLPFAKPLQMKILNAEYSPNVVIEWNGQSVQVGRFGSRLFNLGGVTATKLETFNLRLPKYEAGRFGVKPVSAPCVLQNKKTKHGGSRGEIYGGALTVQIHDARGRELLAEFSIFIDDKKPVCRS